MIVRGLALLFVLAFSSSCSYPLTQISVSEQSVTKPHTVVGRVESSDWSWASFSDVAKANAVAELYDKARAMGANDLVDVHVANNCWWAWIIIFPTCQSEAYGTAIKYQ